MPLSVDEFRRRVIEAGLLTAEELRGFEASVPEGRRPADGAEYARALGARIHGDKLRIRWGGVCAGVGGGREAYQVSGFLGLSREVAAFGVGAI
ncbi:MAG: hypothetical protein NZ899_14395 [Thermoguttaceae bacterium]|nr:hypothetical protein [Thermoguttaceae bacterium]